MSQSVSQQGTIRPVLLPGPLETHLQVEAADIIPNKDSECDESEVIDDLNLNNSMNTIGNLKPIESGIEGGNISVINVPSYVEGSGIQLQINSSSSELSAASVPSIQMETSSTHPIINYFPALEWLFVFVNN